MDELERIDDAVATWRQLAPDLDTSTMRTGLVVGRATILAKRHVEGAFAEHGLSSGEFDVLASLLQMPDHTSTPSELAKSGMLSPAGMTHRLDLLERAGLVERHPDPNDRRSTLIRLTPLGQDTAITSAHAHVAAEAEMFDALSSAERRTLESLLTKIIRQLNPEADAVSAHSTTEEP